jgi:hypothetical protein
MATSQQILQQMYDAIESDVENLDSQLAQIDEQISDLEDQASAIEGVVMTGAADRLEEYLDSTKVLEIEQINGTDAELVIGPKYNDFTDIANANLTDWKIIDSTSSETLYKYEGVGWDEDSLIINLISDWNFGKDYLLHPLDTFDGTYGLYARISALTNSRNTIQATRTKISDSGPVFENYL